MKNQQNISQLKKYKIPYLLTREINGGEKRATARTKDDLE